MSTLGIVVLVFMVSASIGYGLGRKHERKWANAPHEYVDS